MWFKIRCSLRTAVLRQHGRIRFLSQTTEYPTLGMVGHTEGIEVVRPVRGTQDRFGNENAKFEHLRKIGCCVAELHCFEQISIPVLEFSRVFERTLGQDSDIVGKELYSFVNKDEHLTLRPEGTAGIVRALLSNNRDRELPQRYYYHGPMFRHEKPQKGRLRQFEQFGIEMFGHETPTSDIEVIDLAWSFLNKIRLSGTFELEINSLADMESRLRYRNVVRDYLRQNESQLSEDSVKRISTNPLRVLDSKNQKDVLVVQNCPLITEYYSPESAERFDIVCQGLQRLGIPYKINPRLVRGLDYYENTIFEFKCDHPHLGASQGTILAGGRYDGLVQSMGGKEKIPGIGWAAGIDRLALILDETFALPKERPVAVIVIQSRDESSSDDTDNLSTLDYHGLNISKSLRSHDIKTLFYHAPSSARKSKLKTSLGSVLKANASHAILVGEDEVGRGEVTVKYLDSKIQKDVKIDDIVNVIIESKSGNKEAA
ncbi:2307_t:CDS:2 [Acaulospora morrowiae]|uniref:histidine--tRNA ligase n=1 Tax=Acaulospora morrowiae TaxID=94023 RepID=A0A9N8VX46_9GLOM|nr:2307_t:CDS:2 [Acaulospora morrowiae]